MAPTPADDTPSSATTGAATSPSSTQPPAQPPSSSSSSSAQAASASASSIAASASLNTSVPPMTSNRPPKLDDVATRLTDVNLDPSKRALAAQELREHAEVYQSQDFPNFIRTLFAVFAKAFEITKPAFKSEAPEHRIRNAILETFRKLSSFEPAKSRAKQLMPIFLAILKDDNEDNAELTMKILSDMLKSCRDECEEFAVPFFDQIKHFFGQMASTVDTVFGPSASDTTDTSQHQQQTPTQSAADQTSSSSSAAAQPGQAPRALLPATAGFKVLADCPIAIVLILQTYPQTMRPALNSFIPLIFDGCLLLQAPPQKQAHEAAKQRGEIQIGMTNAIKNKAAYAEMIQAQIKTMSFLAYVIKSGLQAIKDYAPILPGVSVRLLEDCPADAAAARKELLVAVRHILSTEFRIHFASQIDTLLDDRVLLGTGVTSRELHRPLAISMLADLIHHSRAELSPAQLARIVSLHGKVLHDPTLAPAIQTMCAKLLLNLVEAIMNNDVNGANNLLRQILDCFIEKMANLPRYKADWEANRRRREAQAATAAAATKGSAPPTLPVDAVFIERTRPIQAGHMLYEIRETDVLKDVLFLLRNLLTGFKTLLALLKRRGAPEPEADTFSKLFRSGVECWSMVDAHREGNQDKEMMDLFIPIFYDLSPPVFHEIFTDNLPFLYERMLDNDALVGVPQNLLSMQSTSRRFSGIVFRFLADRLDELGHAPRQNATVTLRLFKLAFMAVTIYPEENEVMLQPHLCYFIMQSMRLAAKAKEPSNYFMLLRALFRSIGGGKFELLYKDVLPLLPVLLEQLHGFLDASESPQRETFVDLCLTVPVRLSALLPYLGYLMRPLVLALRSSGDLLSQGLRTLELCIDNLTQEFLDPIMAPYQTEIMNALWDHLQPLPHPHAHSHTTMRILGKMGGRNRRILQKPPHIDWHSQRDSGHFEVSFGPGQTQSMSLQPIVDLALAHVRRGDQYYRKHSWELLQHSAALYVDGTLVKGSPQKEHAFEKIVQGLFEATRVEEFGTEAREFVLKLSVHVLGLEAKRFSEEPNPRELPGAGLSFVTMAFIFGIAEAMSSIANDAADLESHTDLLLEIVSKVKDVCRFPGSSSAADKSPTLWLFLIKRLSSRLCGFCYDKLWAKKTGGWTGINALIRRASLPIAWLRDNQLEIVRALVFMLKDMPPDPPRNAEAVGETLIHVLEEANKPRDGNDDDLTEEDKAQWARQRDSQQTLLIGALVQELSSANSMVRSVTREAFRLLAQMREQSITQLLTPVKDRLLVPIFTKPLRALPFGMQIGHIDAITFCLELDPPLPTFNEELFRVLTEACALADADDAALVGRSAHYKNTVAVTQLRVVAIRLLASAMNRPEFQGPRHNDQRLRIISMYFKSLYSRSQDVVDVAFTSLKDTLQDHAKLPKDVLRSGLSPILQTLADSSKLTVVGLDGLARLLKLLTTYFKVEIGGKLLSHMQAISQTSVLEKAAGGDLEAPGYADAHHLLHSSTPRDSDVIQTLCAIVRVFPLLPPAALQFLETLVSSVIHIETVLRRTGPTPFTRPLATYLNKYPGPSCEYFGNRLDDPRHARCFRLCLGAPEAAELRKEATNRKGTLIIALLATHTNVARICTALELIKELVHAEPDWLLNNPDVFQAVLDLWKSPESKQRRRQETNPTPRCEFNLLLDVFKIHLAKKDDTDAYFALLDAFTFFACIDMTPTLRFCYEHVAIKGSIPFKQDIISKWINVFEDLSLSQEYKLQVLRVLVNPLLQATPRPSKEDKSEDGEKQQGEGAKEQDKDKAAEEPSTKKSEDVEMKDASTEAEGTAPSVSDDKKPAIENLITPQLASSICERIWKASYSKGGAQLCSDDSYRVELLHMSTVALEHCHMELGQNGSSRRDTIKFGWAQLSCEDITVKNAAYVFIARFLEYCDSPIKIIGQVHTGMLRLEKTEAKGLLRRALDILTPALPTRVPAPTDDGVPLWVRWTKPLLSADSQPTNVLVNVLQLLVRHSDQFFPYRDSFIPGMASSLPKLSSSQSSEHRVFAIDVIDLIFRWERKRLTMIEEKDSKGKTDKGDEESKQGEEPSGDVTNGKRQQDDSHTTESGSRKRVRLDANGIGASPSPAASALPDELVYSVPKGIRESIVNYLLRSICFSTDAMTRGTVGRAFLLYREIAISGFWNVCDIKLNMFQRPLMTSDLADAEPFSSAYNIVFNSLQALRVICKEKSDAWFVAHAPQLCKLLERSVRTKQPGIVDLTRPILQRVFEAVPDIPAEDKDADGEEDDDAAMESKPAAGGETKPPAQHDPDDVPAIVRAFGDKAVQEGLHDSQNVFAAFTVLLAWGKSKPERIDVYVPQLIKNISKLTRELLNLQQPTKVYSSENHSKLLIMALDVTRIRISHLGEHRRWWLSAAVQLEEKSTSPEILRFLLNTLSTWVLDSDEPFPTVKEKAGLLVKMISFESRADEGLFREYLDLIYKIYTTPSLARSELTVKLEPAFMIGCRHRDPVVRRKFLDVFDKTLAAPIAGRLQYLLGHQSWEPLAEHYWVTQALDLLLGSVDMSRPLVPAATSLSSRSSPLVHTIRSYTVGGLLQALRHLLYASKKSTHDIWVKFFPAAWAALPRKHQLDVTRSLIGVLTREYHLRQVSRRPNVVQTILEGAHACKPQPELPPHVVKYLGKTFKAWHTAADMLQTLIYTLPREDDSIRDSTQDAQAEMFAELAETDYFYGLWRRRCVYAESNSALAYEQSGSWAKAQVAYENAQMKARTGVLTFTEAEYSLWEDHWVICAQKLQQWETLTDLAKLEGNNDLLLECAWRLSDWVNEKDYLEQALDSLASVPTPRRRVFAAFMALLKQQERPVPSEFGGICDEAIQLSLRKWHSLPSTVSEAHIPLLQIFQQLFELQEASSIFQSLSQTNAANIDQRSTELKTLMQTWRERLPNLWDDINAWSDLVAWRQHVFSAVNKAYLPLVPQIQNGAQGSTNSYAYRGYHETAWIINRFAHVARKHHLNDVCISSLTKIYTLPNIEIQEAFLKLREQAKCHYQNPNELAAGLEVINNTNLMFFAASQKAEFFTLKGMFMDKLDLHDDANHAFATAIQMDMNLAKAWVEWGRYNDRLFRVTPTNMFYASSAMSCYLQAASLYKNGKVRKILVRILWLLGNDHSQNAAITAFDGHRGEHPTWYWITFIPQLLSSLSSREVHVSKRILMSIAKSFPQALYYNVRATKEEFNLLRRNLAMHRAQQARQQMAQVQAQQQQQQQLQQQLKKESEADSSEKPATTNAESGAEADSNKMDVDENKSATDGKDSEPAATQPKEEKDSDAAALNKGQSGQTTDSPAAGSGATNGSTQMATSTSNNPAMAGSPGQSATSPQQEGVTSSEAPANGQANGGAAGLSPSSALRPGQAAAHSAAGAQSSESPAQGPLQPWDQVETILNGIKTSFPLLALTMESMAEQIVQRFKATPEEDLHRLMNALLSEALQQYVTRATSQDDDGRLPTPTRQNLQRFSENLHRSPLRSSFEEDFIKPDLTLRECVQKLQMWRDRYENIIDKRPVRNPLEHCSHYLVEFQHLKFDEVEVPGQYLTHTDNNSDFVKINRFSNVYELTRSSGACTRRLSMISNKGITHSFAVQLNTPRHCRREERMMQLLRLLNGSLEKRIETRKRGLSFYLPAVIPLATQTRLVETDGSFLSLQDIYEEFCKDVGMNKGDPLMLWVEKLKSTYNPTKGLVELANLRMDLLDEISTKMVPETILSNFMTKSMASPEDLWLMRKQFSLQTAATMFLTYVFYISARTPNRMQISRSSGVIYMTDLLPTFNPAVSHHKPPDATPFRLTPNMQHFIGPIGVEGVLTASLMAIARCVSEPDGKFEDTLGIFVRDDIRRDTHMPIINRVVAEVGKRAKLLSGTPTPSDGAAPTIVQVPIDLINSATSCGKLALQDCLWAPWL